MDDSCSSPLSNAAVWWYCSWTPQSLVGYKEDEAHRFSWKSVKAQVISFESLATASLSRIFVHQIAELFLFTECSLSVISISNNTIAWRPVSLQMIAIWLFKMWCKYNRFHPETFGKWWLCFDEFWLSSASFFMCFSWILYQSHPYNTANAKADSDFPSAHPSSSNPITSFVNLMDSWLQASSSNLSLILSFASIFQFALWLFIGLVQGRINLSYPLKKGVSRIQLFQYHLHSLQA